MLRIRYTANSFAHPRRVRFRYRLSNQEEGWRDETDERVAYYTGLRPGRYRFEVKAANPHGVWNEIPAAFEFSLAPHFWQTWPFYVLCAIGVVGLAGGVQAYRLNVQRRILRLEREQALQLERARIARDLHDELGSRLTALALHSDLAGRNPNKTGEEHWRSLAAESRALAERMRDVIWAVDPECDSLEALASRLAGHAEEFLGTAGIRLRLELPEVLPTLPMSADARHQLTMVAKEALHNVLKHARASEVRLAVELRDGVLRLCVSDNGAGLAESRHGGRGLANMRARVQALGGVLRIQSQPGQGTAIEASVTLKNLGQPRHGI